MNGWIQCELKAGHARLVSYIPGELATIGNEVEYKGTIWIVAAVYQHSQRIVTAHVDGQIRQHRKATGDATRKT